MAQKVKIILDKPVKWRYNLIRKEKEVTTMKLFKRNNKVATKELKITYRWIDEDEIHVEIGNSAGLAMLEADWCIEVLSVEAL